MKHLTRALFYFPAIGTGGQTKAKRTSSSIQLHSLAVPIQLFTLSQSVFISPLSKFWILKLAVKNWIIVVCVCGLYEYVAILRHVAWDSSSLICSHTLHSAG